MTEIICHIVGMNNLMKQTFISNINSLYPNIIIKDLDSITHKIRNNQEMVKLNNQLKKTRKGNNRSNIIKNIHSHWKVSLTKSINNVKKRHNKKKIIFLGLSTYHKNHRLKVNMETKNKFFIKINSRSNARQIVEYNLEKYKRYIINGSFPLRYIDHEFLIKQRDRLNKVYKNMGYKQISIPSLEKWFELSFNDVKYGKKPLSKTPHKTPLKTFHNNTQSAKPNSIFVGSKNKYEKFIPVSKKPFRKSILKIDKFLSNNLANLQNDIIIGYSKKWLAPLLSISNINKLIKKGYMREHDKVIPFIEEKYKGSFEHLFNSCFLYEIDAVYFDKKIGINKYSCEFNAEFENVIYIDNIYSYLEKEGVKIIKYRNQ